MITMFPDEYNVLKHDTFYIKKTTWKHSVIIKFLKNKQQNTEFLLFDVEIASNPAAMG